MNKHPPLELPSHEILSQLARDDPQAYEALRSEVIESFIHSAPERLKPRLNGIQFHVDGLRRLSRSSALGATVRIYTLMWESFERLNQSWQSFRLEPVQHGPQQTAGFVSQHSARVLQFRPQPPCDQYRGPATRGM